MRGESLSNESYNVPAKSIDQNHYLSSPCYEASEIAHLFLSNFSPLCFLLEAISPIQPEIKVLWSGLFSGRLMVLFVFLESPDIRGSGFAAFQRAARYHFTGAQV